MTTHALAAAGGRAFALGEIVRMKEQPQMWGCVVGWRPPAWPLPGESRERALVLWASPGAWQGLVQACRQESLHVPRGLYNGKERREIRRLTDAVLACRQRLEGMRFGGALVDDLRAVAEEIEALVAERWKVLVDEEQQEVTHA